MTVAKVEKTTPTAAEVETIVTGKAADYAVTLDREIRAGFSVVLESQHRLTEMVEEAKNARIHKSLVNPETGKAYRSWVEYITGVLSGLGLSAKGMPAKDKAFLIVMLYNTGLPQKGIAKALSISPGTVNTAIAKGRGEGLVDENRETTTTDGRTFKKTEGEGAKKTVTEVSRGEAAAKRALSALKTINTVLSDGADEETREAIKALLGEMQTELTAAKKATK